MRDFKQAAAGEPEEETSQLNERPNENNVSMEIYASQVIEHLETFTGRQLSESETTQWRARLARYPKWKLDKLIDYTGGLNNEVFKFLDTLQPPMPKFKSLPEPPPTTRGQQIAKDFSALIQGVRKFEGSREDRLKWEWSEAERLDRKWPQLDVMKFYRGEKRFEGIV